MKKKNKILAKAKVNRTVLNTVNGEPDGGYIEVIVTVGTQWRRLFFRLDTKKTGTKER